MGTNQTTNISKKLDIKDGNGEQSINTNDYIDSLTTFNKLCLAQNLLKEMYSLKERFEENKEKMIGQIEQNCYKYYKNKLNSKEIYDYFESNKIEERRIYKLTNNSKFIYENKIYRNFYDFLFILRNNNSLILEIINNCDPKYYKDLSYFIVHFFYKDICDCSFYQEELLLIIYLTIENAMNKSLPEKLTSSTIKKDRDLYNNQLNNNFIYYLFKSLTRKADIRNYLSSFVSDIIIKLEEYRDTLSTDPKVILKSLENNDIKKDILKQFEELNPSVTLPMKRSQNLDNLLIKLNPDEELAICKDNKRQKETIRKSINNIKKRLSISNSKDIEEKLGGISKQNDKGKDDINPDKIKIDSFFHNEDIAYTYICERLNYYENIKDKDKKTYAIIEYLDILLNEITKDGEPVEIFSTIVLKNELKMCKIDESNEDYENLINKLKSNYDFITSFISNLLIKTRENLDSFPFSLQCIFKIIEELYNKKVQNTNKKGPFNYLLLIIKARILFGCMILPMLSNPDYSGIYTDGIISQITKDNINIIVKILKVAISGNLFLVESSGYTIYNKFIIDTLSNIFDIIIDIDKNNENINLPNFITNLINEFPEKINDKERNINYDYFKEKIDNEKIQFQSLCFSWKDLMLLINTMKKNKNNFNDKYKNDEEKNIVNNILINKEYNQKILDNYNENKNKKTFDYYFITKIIYQKEFEEKINAILKDNFDILFQGQINDEQVRFKKCLTEVLSYVNYLKKEDFIEFIKKKNGIILDKNSDINKYYKYKREQVYENTNFEKRPKKVNIKNQNDLVMLKKNLKKVEKFNFIQMAEKNFDEFYCKRKGTFIKVVNDEEMKEDLDFKDIIFPRIYSKVMSEIYYNPERGKSQRIIFCISYIQEYINDLPKKYSENNFKKIFVDILKEPEILIKELQYNILNKYHSKIRNSEKLNLISTKDSVQIKNMERNAYIGYLFNKIKLIGNLKVNFVNKKINSVKIELNPNNKSIEMNLDTIQSFVDKMPNFRHYETNEDIINLEKKLKIDEIINNYFKEINNLVKDEKIISRFSADEKSLIEYELENYVLFKLYDKLFPTKSTKEDQFFYKKCSRLNFVKPENIIKNKKMINEKLLEISVNYISEMDKKLTPLDKIKIFGKAIDILKNSMTFNSGKADLGLDDTLPFIIYILLKSKQEKIYTNFNYCNLFINPEFSKKHYGSMLTQLGMVMDIIKNMKYNELIGVSEQQFGKDE